MKNVDIFTAVLQDEASPDDPPLFEPLLAICDDINEKSASGFTLLMAAAKTGKENIVRHLIENGADVNLRNDENNYTALMYAAMRGHLETVRLLSDCGAEINPVCVYGDTPLSLAVAGGAPDVVRFLADKGADIHHKKHNLSLSERAQTAQNRTTLTDGERYHQIIKILEEAGKKETAAQEEKIQINADKGFEKLYAHKPGIRIVRPKGP